MSVPTASAPSLPLGSRPTPHARPPSRVTKEFPRGWLGFVGILALIALVVEAGTHIWGSILFDPIPTWWHFGAVATVPFVYLWGVFRLADSPRRVPRWLIHLQAFSFGVALCYTVAFLPTLPIGLLGMVYLVGLLPLCPFFVFFSAIPIRGYLRARYELETHGRTAPSVWPGFLVAVGLLCLSFAQGIYTASLAVAAESSDPAVAQRAVKKLRWFGSEESLRTICYGLNGGDFLLWKPTWFPQPNSGKARATYYRVHGETFDGRPMPGRVRMRREFEVRGGDFDLGGDKAAGKVSHLSLASSRLDGQFNSAAALAYTEWTMVFKNTARNAKEARAQIELPPGGVVSRVTLWINGEPCEAAFGSRGQVRAAYQEVAVVRNRDPILVTTSGPDRVLMQCYPVPAYGEMKIRVGMTAPLILQTGGGATLPLPRFLETNFADEKVSHQMFYDSDVTLVLRGKDAGKTIRQEMSDAELREGVTLQAQLTAEAGAVFTADPMDPQFAIQQAIEQRPVARPGSVVFVVDGSKLAGPYHNEIASALTALPEGLPFHVVMAGDETTSLWEGLRPSDSANRAAAAKAVGDTWARGGANNLAALNRAWDVASRQASSVVVWLHGPQPVLLGDLDSLLQRVERDKQPPILLTASLSGGPNRIAEKLDAFPGLRALERQGSIGDSLRQLFARWSAQTLTPTAIRTRVPVAEVSPAAKKVDKHLARLWGREEVERLRAGGEAAIAAATKLATSLQLVTPLTGAVVLETKAQYDRHNLQAADPNTVPVIPEPTSALLLALGASGLLFRRRRAQSAARV